MAMIECRECKKQISDQAPACPNCGAPTRRVGVNPGVKNKSGGTSIGTWVVAGLALLGVCSYAVGKGKKENDNPSGSSSASSASRPSSSGTAPAPEPARDEPPLEVDNKKLWADYKANEVAADDVYKGKSLLVSGVVHSIDKGAFGGLVVRLSSQNPFMSTMVRLEATEKDSAAALRKGDKVKVLCTGGGLTVGTPVLRGCTFR